LVRPGSGDNGKVQRISSGNSRFDEMLGGGYPKGSTTMLVGPSGTGKTSLGLQFLARSSKDEPGLLFSFYEGPHQIRSKVNAIYPAMMAILQAGDVALSWQAPTDQLVDELADRLLEQVRRRKVRRLLVDGLGGFKKAVASRLIEPFFAALVHQLGSEGVTTVCTAEVSEIIGPTITTPLRGLSDVTDNHVLMRFVEVGATLYRLISILKVRDSHFDSSLREFSISKNGVEISETRESAERILSSSSTLQQTPATTTVSEE
jgi:circadian clock protein KaiC